MNEVHHIPDEVDGTPEHTTRNCWCRPLIEDLKVNIYSKERVVFHRETGHRNEQ